MVEGEIDSRRGFIPPSTRPRQEHAGTKLSRNRGSRPGLAGRVPATEEAPNPEEEK